MSRQDEVIDSAIEQQLSSDDELFNMMAQGVDDGEEAEAPEPQVEQPKQKPKPQSQPEQEEDLPTNEPDDDDYEVEEEEEVEDEEYEVEEDDTPPQKSRPTKLYTPQEIKELLADGDFSKVDTSRLSEEGKLVMKSMQAGLTPKLQEAAELRKALQALDEKVEKALPKPPPKDIYEAYDQDPDGVMSYIEKQIDVAIDNQDKVSLDKLREARERIRIHASKPKPVEDNTNKVAIAATELLRAIPDIEDKQNDLKKYALEVMGYDPEELIAATDISIRGEAAVKEILRINRAYDKYQAPRKAQAKAKRKKPTQVEKTGGGFDSQKESTMSDMVREAAKKAKSGDGNAFFDVFLAMEE